MNQLNTAPTWAAQEQAHSSESRLSQQKHQHLMEVLVVWWWCSGWSWSLGDSLTCRWYFLDYLNMWEFSLIAWSRINPHGAGFTQRWFVRLIQVRRWAWTSTRFLSSLMEHTPGLLLATILTLTIWDLLLSHPKRQIKGWRAVGCFHHVVLSLRLWVCYSMSALSRVREPWWTNNTWLHNWLHFTC